MISLNRPQILQTALVYLIAFVALASIAWVLAYWTWQWFSPQTPLRLPGVPASTARPEAAIALFGKPPQEMAAPASAISVLGVIAAVSDGAGYAILQYGQQPSRPIKEKEEIAPGIRLVKVHPDKVILERNGLLETLTLSSKKIPVITASTSKK